MKNHVIANRKLIGSDRLHHIVAISILWCCLIVDSEAAWNIIQVTSNTISDQSLMIGESGGNLLWKDSANNVLYYSDGTTISTVYTGASNSFHIDGTVVVFQAWVGSDWDILRWEAGSTSYITNDTTTDIGVKVSGANVAWEKDYGGSNWEITLNGIRLTSNTWPDEYIQMSSPYLAWVALETYAGGSYNHIRMYNGSTTLTLTNNGDTPTTAGMAISGNHVVWLANYEGTDREVAYYNGTSTLRLTNNSYDELSVDCSGNNVVWQGTGGSDGGTDNEIFFL